MRRKRDFDDARAVSGCAAMTGWGYTDEELATATEQWQTWAAALPRGQEAAATAAVAMLSAGGTPEEAQAAGRISAGVIFATDQALLNFRAASAHRVAAELRRQRPGADLTAAALEEAASRYTALASAAEAALGSRAVLAQKGGLARFEVSLTEVLAYGGAIAVLVGLGFLVGFQGQQLGDSGRLAIYVLVTVAALGVGLLVEPKSNRAPIRRARASSLLLAVAALYALTAEAATDFHLLTRPGIYPGSGPDQIGNLMLAGAAATLLGAPLLLRTRALLVALATAAASYAAVGAFVAWRSGGEAWTNEAAWLAAGGLLVVLVELARRQEGGRWAVEVTAILALAPPALAAYVFAPAGSDGLGLLLLGGGLAAAASLAAVVRHSPGYAMAAGIGLFGFAVSVPVHYFGQPWAILLLVAASGVVLTHAEFLRRRTRTTSALEVLLCFAGGLAPVPLGLFEIPIGLRGLLPLALLGCIAAAASVAAIWRGNPGYAVAAGFGLATFAVSVPAFLNDSPLAAAALILAASAVVVAHAERQRNRGRRGLGVEMLAFFGLITPVGFGLSLASGQYQVAFEMLAGLLAVSAFAAAVARSSRGYAVAGGVGLFAFTLTVGFRHFSNSIGFAGVLVASGLVLIGLAFVLAQLLPRLRARRAGATEGGDQDRAVPAGDGYLGGTEERPAS